MSAGLIATVLRRRRTWGLLLLSLAIVIVTAMFHGPGPHGPPADRPPPSCGLPMMQVEPAPAPVPVPEPAREPAPWSTDDAFFLEIVGDRVYWNENSGLWSAKLDRSDRPTRHASGFVLTFVIEGDYATYTTGREIRRVRLDGRGQPETLVTEWEDPINLVSDGKHLYYTMFKGHDLMRADWKGGRNKRFAQGGGHFNIAVDDTYLYVAEYKKKGRIVRYPKRGGAGKVLAQGIKRPVGIAIDATHVYFPVEGDGSLRRVPKKGGRMETLAEKQFNHDILAVDDTHIYWGDWGTHALMRTRKDGRGEPEVLASDRRSIVGIAVNDRYIAFSVQGHLEIIEKP